MTDPKLPRSKADRAANVFIVLFFQIFAFCLGMGLTTSWWLVAASTMAGLLVGVVIIATIER